MNRQKETKFILYLLWHTSRTASVPMIARVVKLHGCHKFESPKHQMTSVSKLDKQKQDV